MLMAHPPAGGLTGGGMKTQLITKLQGKRGSFEYNHGEGVMRVYGDVTLEEMAEAIETINGQNEPPTMRIDAATTKEKAH